MHSTSENTQVDPHSLEQGFEQSEMQTSLVWAALVVLLVLMVGAGFVILLMMRGYEEARVDRSPLSPAAGGNTEIVGGTHAMMPGYNGPLVQQNPVYERKLHVAASVEKLESYGKHEAATEGGETTSIGHIPIELAMQHLAEGKVDYKQEPVTAQIQQQ
ncbi:MAG: hypothetical protein GC168_14245 [Candidatus Hydrogenedens sp.]|nr:hypothetical protein [Candidatus Hydrogenedens sp.]